MTPRLLVAMSELRTAIRRPDADLDTALQRFAEAILAHPPADEPCGQQAPREAVPAKRCSDCDPSFGCFEDRSLLCCKKPTPPAAAPAPFMEVELEWSDWRAEGWLGEEAKSFSKQNAQKLRKLIGEMGAMPWLCERAAEAGRQAQEKQS